MVALRGFLQAVAVGSLAVAASAAGTCTADAFKYPDLFGAGWEEMHVGEVHNFTLTTGTPEGKLIPGAGFNVCNITLRYHHPGQNDTTKVQVWLPLENWNGRFAGAGGGGFRAGVFDGETLAATVALGYAAATTDASVDSTDWKHARWALKSPGNINYPLLYNFATIGIHDMTVIGKDIATQFYGKPPSYSYFNGCSTGGRQGVMSAQQYPDDYDGILAGAPAINLADLTPSTYWPQSVMDRLGVYPSKCELDGINALSVAFCKGINGVQDAIADPDACGFDPQTVVGQVVNCTDGTTVKVSSEAANIVRAVRVGPTGADGRPLWLGTAHGTPLTGTLALANTNCSSTPCVGKPFPMAVDWISLLVRRDPSYNVTQMTLQDLEQNYYLSRLLLGPVLDGGSTDLARFKAGNKKMITWHGMADECITMRSTRNWYDRVVAADASAADYYRHFEAPGVNHCNAVPGVYYPLRALDALAHWVEGGVAPEALVGYKMPNVTTLDANPDVTRPLCRYPNVLKFNGGDVDGYGSYSCVAKSDGSKDASRTRDEL